MLVPPPDVHDGQVLAAIEREWSIRPRLLKYQSVGFGSHHWMTEEHFVTLDPASAVAALRPALATATALRDEAGLEFVVAPIPTCTGDLLAELNRAWVLHLYPRLDIVDATTFGPHTDPAVVELVRAVHDATALAAGRARWEDFAIPARAELEAALAALGEPWDTGPYGERARQILAAQATGVRQLLGTHDQLVAATARSGWVITHGEPHRGNLFRTTRGWAMVDWDTALVAPPERDLWDLPACGDPATERLYRLRWDLSEIAIYVAGFRAPHGNDRNDQTAWTGLVTYLDLANRWPNLA